MSDATAGEIEDHRLGRRIVARAADQLDHPSCGGRRERNAGRRPARSDRTVGDPADRGPDDDDHRLRVRGSHRRLSVRVGNETGVSQGHMQTQGGYYRMPPGDASVPGRVGMVRSRAPNAANPSTRGQAMAEFALVLPIMLMMFIVIADFGRIFAAMITLESATRDAAEAAANLYIANPPGGLIDIPAPDGYAPAYYDALHSPAAQVVCADMRGLPNTNYDAGTNTCPDMPLVMVCVHDSQDTGCSSLASPGATDAAGPVHGLQPAARQRSGRGRTRPPTVGGGPDLLQVHGHPERASLQPGRFLAPADEPVHDPLLLQLGTDECGDTP